MNLFVHKQKHSEKNIYYKIEITNIIPISLLSSWNFKCLKSIHWDNYLKGTFYAFLVEMLAGRRKILAVK